MARPSPPPNLTFPNPLAPTLRVGAGTPPLCGSTRCGASLVRAAERREVRPHAKRRDERGRRGTRCGAQVASASLAHGHQRAVGRLGVGDEFLLERGDVPVHLLEGDGAEEGLGAVG